MSLRAVVVGAGFAGEGHTLALRAAGVDIVALCGRDPSALAARARALGVPAATDWRAALTDLRPDIVTVATPAALRTPVVEAAAARGAHLLCEKPLATTPDEARRLWEIADAAGVTHAYAATRVYAPGVEALAQRVAAGEFGALREARFRLRGHLAPPLPWSWALSLAQGGGLLNNHGAHALAVAERIVGGPIVSATGVARFEIDRAPLVDGLHDFRDWSARADTLTDDQIAALPWRACDIDTSYSAELTIAGVAVTLVSGPEVEAPSLTLVGERRTETFPGELAYAADGPGATVQARWDLLAAAFVADIRGEPHAPHLTFRDGARHAAILDAIRIGTEFDDLSAAVL